MRNSSFLVLLSLGLLSACTLLNPAGTAMGVAAPSPEQSLGHCLAHSATHTSPVVADQPTALDREIEQFQLLAERALGYRQTAIEVAGRFYARLDTDTPLSGADLELVHEGTREYLAMRQQLWTLAGAHECWIDPPEALRAQLDPRVRTDGILMSLSAALLLYDNYLLTAAVFDQDTRLRRVLNQPEKGYGLPAHRLTEIKSSFMSPENSQRMQAAIAYYQKVVASLPETDDSPVRAYLRQLIAQSPSFAALQNNQLPADLKLAMRQLRTLSGDTLAGLSREGLNLFSMVFGNTVGLVETRKGKLYRQPGLERKLAAQLRAGDILLEKTPFRLTDLMIPGYWGHAAIWVGSEAELRELGVWDHPAVRPHQEAIRRGKRIVEALRAGVVLNSFAHFLNVDDLAVLRPPRPEPAAQAARVVRAFRQLGKAYDFNFDVETTDRIVCSELIYQVYTELPWPTSRQLGRATISPDQVALRAIPGGPLKVILLVESGRLVETDPAGRMQALVGGSGPVALISNSPAKTSVGAP